MIYIIVGLLGVSVALWCVLEIGHDVFLGLDYNKPPKTPRHKANLQILAHLLKYIDENPDQRFGQILRNTGVVVDVGVRDSIQEEWETPDYYWARGVHEESIATLVRMEAVRRGIYEEIKVVEKK